MARVRLIAPRDLRVHEQFVLRSGDGLDQGMSFGTPACRYWKGRKNIFLTHLRWTVGDEYHEISRTAVVRTWVEAYNIITRLAFIQLKIRGLLAIERPSEKVFPDPADIIRKRSQDVYMRTIQFLHLFLTNFLDAVISLESRKTAPQEWKDSDMPSGNICEFISPLIDSSVPLIAYPLLVIQLLQKTISDTAQRSTLDDFVKRFVPPDTRMLEELVLPGGTWIGIVEKMAEEDWVVENEEGADLAWADAEGTGYWSKCRKWAMSLFGSHDPMSSVLPKYRPESSLEEKRPLLASAQAVPGYASSSGQELKSVRKQDQ